jgi:hypothetical protein
MQIESNLPSVIDVDARLDEIAKRYSQAGGVGINVLNLIGGSAENLIDRLPNAVRRNLEAATIKALNHAMRAAHSSRSYLPDQKSWLNQAASAAMGAAGGAGGLPTALAELPVTTTLLLRVIQGVAVEHGFDPNAENVQFDCVQVFSAAGPLSGDDGADLGAVAGAATNYAYTSYYQDMAHVHFGLRRLAIEGDVPSEELLERLRQKMGRAPVAR